MPEPKPFTKCRQCGTEIQTPKDGFRVYTEDGPKWFLDIGCYMNNTPTLVGYDERIARLVTGAMINDFEDLVDSESVVSEQ